MDSTNYTLSQPPKRFSTRSFESLIDGKAIPRRATQRAGFSTRSFESLIDGANRVVEFYAAKCFSTRSFESLIDGFRGG